MQSIYISVTDKDKQSQLIIDGQLYLLADLLEILTNRTKEDADEKLENNNHFQEKTHLFRGGQSDNPTHTRKDSLT